MADSEGGPGSGAPPAAVPAPAAGGASGSTGGRRGLHRCASTTMAGRKDGITYYARIGSLALTGMWRGSNWSDMRRKESCKPKLRNRRQRRDTEDEETTGIETELRPAEKSAASCSPNAATEAPPTAPMPSGTSPRKLGSCGSSSTVQSCSHTSGNQVLATLHAPWRVCWEPQCSGRMRCRHWSCSLVKHTNCPRCLRGGFSSIP